MAPRRFGGPHRAWAVAVLAAAVAACGGAATDVGHDAAPWFDAIDVPDDDGGILVDLTQEQGSFDAGDADGATDAGAEVRSDAGADECRPGEMRFGCACKENADCVSQYCVFHLGGLVCSRACDAQCPAGWACHQFSATDTNMVCVSTYAHLCLPCRSATDCGDGDACVAFSSEVGSFCGGACEQAEDCPDGFVCVDATSVDGHDLAKRQCVPASGECSCSEAAVAKGLATECHVTNAWGTCSATRACLDSGLSPCDARLPAPEKCANGVDDDCDGDLDGADADCGDCHCGDGVCQTAECGEAWDDQVRTCAADCASCGNGTCDPGEGPVDCFEDCCGGCGDGICKGGECGEGPANCPQDCTDYSCGDGFCDAAENAVDCPDDCHRYKCGNHTCEPGEDSASCSLDCSAACGDCECGGGESYGTCPTDCGSCGDGYCLSTCANINEETKWSCPLDCCFPACVGKECGPDGCNGVCGVCGNGKECDASGTCVCAASGPDDDCDGVDDDCDGATDEAHQPLATTCGVGGCVATGATSCVDGNLVNDCVPGPALDETCNGVDDDCDGAPDEGGDALCLPWQMCQQAAGCVCKPDCAGKTCGDDGCGGSCGACLDHVGWLGGAVSGSGAIQVLGTFGTSGGVLQP